MRKIDKYKSRRNIALVSSLVLLVASLMLFCACSCGHEHDSTATKIEATCEKGSYYHYECDCGLSYNSTENDDKLGHDFYGDICQRCGYEREHAHSYEHRVIEPTCTTDGYDEYVCTTCLDVKQGTEKKPAIGHRYIKDECEKCGDIREHVHEYIGTFYQPTCVAEGYLISSCFCGDIKIGTDRVPATGHNFVDDACENCGIMGEHIHKFTSRVVDAKCDVDGYTMHECQCGYTYKGEEIFEKLGHNYVNDVCTRCSVSRDHTHSYVPKTTHPTCLIDGYVTYECQCGSDYIGDETISALGHNFVNESCSRCGTHAPHQHSYTSYVVNPSCEADGYIIFMCACSHSYKSEEVIPKNGHKYSGDECSVCGQRRDHIHSYTMKVVNAKCEENGYVLFECRCSYSYRGEEELPALGHSYENGICKRCNRESHIHNYVPNIVEAKCEMDGSISFECLCGEKYGNEIKLNKLGHDFVNDKCTRCDVSRDHVHNYKATEVKPTCTDDGYTTYVCECIHSYTDNIVPALGHHYENDKCIRCDKVRKPVQISTAKISINGQSVEEYQVDVGVNNIALNVIINLGASLDDFIAPEITWSIVGESYGSAINEIGEVTLADFIGKITVRVVIKGENEVTVDLPITVNLPESTSLEYISATVNECFKQEYIEGDIFNPLSIKLWGELNGKNIQITEFSCETKALTPDVTDVKVYYGGLVTEVPVIVKHTKVLQSIVIMSAPTKTKYLEGERFEKSGLKVKAIYDNKEEEILDFIVDTQKSLTLSDKAVVVSYTHNGITRKVEQKIDVYARKLLSITVNDTNARKLYTQGDIFDRSGLIVTATYEGYGSKEVGNYYYSQNKLTVSDKTVEIFFTDGDYTKSHKVIIKVEKPYAQISHVKVMSPKDVSIIWSYSYMTDNGEMIIDNTAYAKNNLKYDKVNGEYEIPMGAVVTATIKNPAVINLSLNDYEQSISYQEKTTSWIMGDADLVLVKSINASGTYSIIRFEGSENDKTFMFGDEWDGYLTEEELVRIKAIFADTENYYYTYLINGEMKRYSDLANIQFNLNSDITVLKNAISSNAKELCLYVDGDQVYSIFVTDEVLLSDLPKFSKEGYDFLGYSLAQGGEQITQEELTALITAEGEEYKLYTRFIKPEIDYSDEFIENGQPTFGTTGTQFVGSWGALGNGYDSNGAVVITYESIVTFNSDGTFTYKVTTKEQNIERVFEYYGEYRIEGNTIKVISISADKNVSILISPYDLSFTLESGKIKADVVVFTVENPNGYVVISETLEKQ